jgi:hypothetical protein
MAFAFPLGPILLVKKLFLAKLGAAAAAGGGSAAAASGSGAAAGGIAGSGIAAGGAASGTAAAGGIAAGGVGAVAAKAITVTAATALLAGGAVEVHHLATPTPPPQAAIVRQHKAPAFQSGGQAAATLPSVPAVKEELAKTDTKPAKAAEEEKKTDIGTTDEPASPVVDVPPVVPTGTTDPVTTPVDPNTAPVEGQGGTLPPDGQTGGTKLPPQGQPQPPKAKSDAQSAPPPPAP